MGFLWLRRNHCGQTKENLVMLQYIYGHIPICVCLCDKCPLRVHLSIKPHTEHCNTLTTVTDRPYRTKSLGFVVIKLNLEQIQESFEQKSSSA